MSKAIAFCLCLAIVLVFGIGALRADSGQVSGEAIFKKLHCSGCHESEGKGAGVSLQQIAKGYAGQADRLTDYLAGKSEAKLEPAKAQIMASHLEQTEKLSPAQRKALVEYLLSFK